MSDNEETQDAPSTNKDPNVSVSASQDERETIYVRHPVLPELKKVITKRGFRILSADFAPEGIVIYSGTTGKPEGHEDGADEGDPSTDKPKGRSGKKA